MEQHKYIPISEFAERAGVTPQAIYKRNDLKLLVKMVEGVKHLPESALAVFDATESTNSVEQPFNKPLSAEERLNAWLESDNERLNAQLQLTMQMLRSEQEKNTTLQEQILKLSNEYVDITKQTNVIASQAQQISAKLLVQAQTETEAKPQPAPEPEPVAPEKKGLFGIFKKNNRGI